MKILRNSFLAISLLTFCHWAIAQEPGPQNQKGEAPIVRLSLIVTDHSNHALDDVHKEQMQVLEDKAPQILSFFSADDRLINYVVAIDTSGSFKKLLGPALDAVRLLINGNREQDETMLIRFISSDKIETAQAFTTDKAKLTDSLKLFQIAGGQSAVVDAIYLSVTAAAEYKASDAGIRRAVVLVSDGEERNSYYDIDTLVKLLRAKDVQVFVIGIVTQLDNQGGLIRPSPRATAEKLLDRVARETGGRIFYPKNVTELMQAATEISHDLRTQYVIGDQRPNNSKGGFHKVEVRIADAPGREKLTAIARAGYLLNPPDSATKDKDRKKAK